ncbi:hypothetical protein OCD79_28070, partial [Bacillus wiedmannii]|nr:hypothetical protein [Bacillus wiedmannii]MCU5415109.1 hypothetical protein [Bacillus wiedmannii]
FQLAHFLHFAFLNSLTCNTFALSLPYFFQLAHFLRFAFPNSLTCNTFALSFSYLFQLATRLRYPFPISFNLQQYNLFLNQVILKKSCNFKVIKLFFSYFE